MSNNKSLEFYRSQMIKLTADGLRKRITGNEWDVLEKYLYDKCKKMQKLEHSKTFHEGMQFIQYQRDLLSNDVENFIEEPKQFEEYYQFEFGGNQ